MSSGGFFELGNLCVVGHGSGKEGRWLFLRGAFISGEHSGSGKAIGDVARKRRRSLLIFIDVSHREEESTSGLETQRSAQMIQGPWIRTGSKIAFSSNY